MWRSAATALATVRKVCILDLLAWCGSDASKYLGRTGADLGMIRDEMSAASLTVYVQGGHEGGLGHIRRRVTLIRRCVGARRSAAPPPPMHLVAAPDDPVCLRLLRSRSPPSRESCERSTASSPPGRRDPWASLTRSTPTWGEAALSFDDAVLESASGCFAKRLRSASS